MGFFIADLLLKFSQLHALGKSSERNHMQLLNWILNNKPLAKEKDNFIFRADDFASPTRQPGKDRYFEDRIESSLDNSPNSILKVCIMFY